MVDAQSAFVVRIWFLEMDVWRALLVCQVVA
jgi:hypothetical protein